MEQASRVSAAASRLRLLQAELADRPAEVRLQELRSEIDRVGKTMSATDRAAFMADLAEQFPRASQTGSNAGNAGPAPVAKAPPPVGPADAPRLADEIGKMWPVLTEDLRQQVRAALGPAMPPAAAGGDIQAPQWRKILGLNPDDPVDPAKANELALALLSLSVSIDRVVCGVWKETNTSGEMKRAENLKLVASQFVRNWTGTGADKMLAEVTDLQLLLYAMLKAIQLFPNMFADRHLARFDPAVIGANVGAAGEKGGGWFGDSKKANSGKCWEEYMRLMAEYDKNSLQEEVKALLTDEVGRVLKQRRK